MGWVHQISPVAKNNYPFQCLDRLCIFCGADLISVESELVQAQAGFRALTGFVSSVGLLPYIRELFSEKVSVP